MKKGNVLAIDLAKSSFRVHLATPEGRVIEAKTLSRKKLTDYVAKADSEVVVMEACGSAGYWARRFMAMGKQVRLIAPQFVKPYVKSNKNDANDAEAIAEAASRATMRFVQVKTVNQQDMNSLHRIRSRLVANRTALVNQIRGLLAEYGIVMAKGHAKLRAELDGIASCPANDLPGDLSSAMQVEIIALRSEYQQLDQRIEDCDKKIERACHEDPKARELVKITGIGPLTATALIAAAGDLSHFKNGRQFAAFLGLVPRQHSTGGKARLGGISKRGDTYLRTLLIHGARAAMISAHKRSDYRSRWASQLKDKKGMNRAAVALANRNVRTVYALIVRGETFDPRRPERQAA
jgi:transposase